MDRRNVLMAMAGTAIAPILAATPANTALAATNKLSGGSASQMSVVDAVAASVPITVADYTQQVLQIGALSLQTSVFAFNKSSNLSIKRFAQLETIETIAVAQSLTSTLYPTPPPLRPANQAILTSLEISPTNALDYNYVAEQYNAHLQLRVLQVRLLQTDPNFADDIVHIALLAGSNIEQHLILLTDLLITDKLG